MNQKLLTKILATTLAVILTFANFVMLGVYATNSYATQDELETQKTVSKDQNIEFDAYFMSDKQNKSHTSKIDMDASTKLYLNVSAKNGYLKNAKIAMTGENNTEPNFEIVSGSELSDSIESIDKNVISLKQINNGTQVVLEVPIRSIKQDVFDLSNFSKINNITLTGSYVNNAGKQIAVSQTINVRNEWTKEVKAVIEQETKTYIPYTNGEQTGTILQTLIKTGLENNSLPIKQTKLTIKVPEINSIKPEEVIVTANNTYATNNQGQEKFTTDNWSYDETTGLITITVNNEANQNKVAWNKQAKDEYIITYKFNEKLEEIKVEQTAQVTITPYNNVIKELNETSTLNIEENEIKGNFVQTNITSVDALSKGYLYTKIDKEISYNEKQTVEVTYANILDSIIIENNIDNFINNEGAISPTTVSNTNYAYYKTTKISKENFEKILGTEGSITLTGENGEQITIINKDTVLDENGFYVYTYTEETNKIKIITTKPVSAGTLEITHEKSLKGKTDYNRAQVESFQTLQLKATVAALNSNTEIAKVEGVKNITLVAPSTKIEASVSNSNLSTVVKNENVEFRVILKTNDITCDLFKNPVVEIVLPSYIKELNIKDVNLLYDKELQIESRKTYVNKTGNIVIQVILKGEDTVYNQDQISKGANLVINTDITLKNLTPTTEDVMKVYVTNENATTYENTQSARSQVRSRTLKASAPSTVQNKAYVESSLKAVAPVGMVTTNRITGYNTKNETVTSISGEEKVGKLETKTETKNATVTMNVINNYADTIKNISILGRIPFEGNKNTATGEDLGSNLTTTLNKVITSTGIDANKVTIYYTINPNATKDLNNAENGWTTSIDNIQNIKSYLIVLNDYEMPTGEVLEFSYGIAIPENLKHNLSTYAIYTVYFDNTKEGTKSESVTATKVGLTTGQGPELEISMTSDVENGKEVEEGQLIKYTISVKNVGKSLAENVKVTGSVPDEVIYAYYTGEEGSIDPVKINYDRNVKEYSETIQSINVGETKTVEYYVEVGELKSENNQLVISSQARVEGFDTTFTSNEVKNKIEEGYLKAEQKLELVDSTYSRAEGDTIGYIIKLTNVNSKEKRNTVVTCTLPEGVSFKEATKNGNYDKTTNTVIWNVGTIEAYESVMMILRVTVNKLPAEQNEKNITNEVVIKTDDRQLATNKQTVQVKKPALSISQNNTTDKKIAVGEIIKYNIVVKNIGAGTASSIKILDKLPEELTYQGVEYIINGQKYESKIGGSEVTISIPALGAGQTIEVTISAKVKDFEGSEKQIKNVARVLADNISEITSNEVTNTIIKIADTSDDPTIEKPIEGRKAISGLAWLDSNGNGARDDNEHTLGGISVVLINSEDGKIVTDIETGKNKMLETNENGEYTFANLKPGKYMVVFLYDSANYALTTYKKEGVNSDKNSDVVSMKINLYNQIRVAGVSDKLELNGETITNIDMGLTVNPQFDLKLDKVITKITATNSEGTKTYDYDDAKLAKLDLSEKTINGTNIIIEYKIRITNEGGVAGYAKKIVDYLPKDVKFSSELNKDWYTSENGNVYNSSLANTLIQPGEKKELTLILTKKMTGENTGLINNNAEIYESYNDLGINDIDSTPANKVQSEDDISSADAMIGVRTGEAYVYITITVISIAILGIGIYLINKKVLRRI